MSEPEGQNLLQNLLTTFLLSADDKPSYIIIHICTLLSEMMFTEKNLPAETVVSSSQWLEVLTSSLLGNHSGIPW